MEIKIYNDSSKYHLGEVLKESLKGFKRSFYLARQLARRDIRAQYRQSVLGVVWAVVPVLMTALVWIFLQASGTIQLSSTGMPYPVFVLMGTTCWSVWTECLSLSIISVNANKSIITKINFDKEALITLGFMKMGFNFLIKLGLLIVFMALYHVVPGWSVFAFFPLLFITMLCCMSIGILLAPIGILYNDIGKAIPLSMQMLMYVSPVVYMSPKSGLMKQLMQYNPFYYMMDDLRNTLTGASIEHGTFWLIFGLITILLFAFSLIVYRVSMPIITERMSA